MIETGGATLPNYKTGPGECESMKVYIEINRDGMPCACIEPEVCCPLTREEAEDLIQNLSEFLDDPMTQWYEE